MKSVVCSAVNNMKDSGIKWLGMVPKHWNISALRYVSSLYTGNSISDEKKFYYTDPIDAIPYISTKDVDVNYQTINYNNGLYIKKNDSLFRVAPKGSVLMCIEGGSAGKKKAYTNQDVAFVNKLCCFLAGDSLFDKFLFYFLMSPSFEHNFNQYLTGIIGGVTIPVIKNIRICLPPLAEQRAIADWLDVKCADIDAAIELQQRIIDKLKAYKTAVIHQAVTKGLDKNLKPTDLKDSGIKWLEMIPKHWNISALRYVSSLYTGNSISDEKKFYYTDPIDAIPYISTKDVDVNYQTINYNNGLYIKKNDSLFRVAPKGSVLMCIEGGSAGKKKAYTNQDVAFVNKLCCFLAGDSLFDKFLFYFLMSPSFEHNFNQYLTGIIGGVTIPVIKNIRICLPPLSEQRAIADWLDAKCADIDATIALKEQKQEKLKAYKKTIIFEYVTGKKQVANINK